MFEWIMSEGFYIIISLFFPCIYTIWPLNKGVYTFLQRGGGQLGNNPYTCWFSLYMSKWEGGVNEREGVKCLDKLGNKFFLMVHIRIHTHTYTTYVVIWMYDSPLFTQPVAKYLWSLHYWLPLTILQGTYTPRV